MVINRHQLREAFHGQGDYTFDAWTFAGRDSLEAMLAPGFFNDMRGILAVGDLIYAGTTPCRTREQYLPQPVPVRRALLMVRSIERDVTVRLVQDYGGPDDPDAPMVGKGKAR
ncbi:hypothetical protein SH611_22420 [Geminicoccaceae bacterium 1502E]|nr:hypothetical protein [Geminicoccaceae bacterium 1502E]